MFILLRNLFGSSKPITYLSLIEKAKADYSFYTKLASGSFLAGISSFFSSNSWLGKIPLITGAVFGTSAGIKGIVDSKQEIDTFTKAHEATKSSEYLATSNLESLTYITAVDKNGIDKFTNKYIEGEKGKIISNEMTRVPTLSLTLDGKGYKHNGGYEIVESTDRVLYKEIPSVPGQYTNKFVPDTSIIDLHSSIIQQLMQKGYAIEDIEKALNLRTAEERESYLNEQLKNCQPGWFKSIEKVIESKKEEPSKEMQKYAEINKAYNALYNYHTPESEEEFFSLANNINNEAKILGADEGYGSSYDSDSDIG